MATKQEDIDKSVSAVKQTAKRKPSKGITATSTRKPNSDYIRLDLKPDGIDLKEYVTKQAAAKQNETGQNISATKYIQDLIKDDMLQKEKGKGAKVKLSHRQEIALLLDKVADKDLKAVEGIIRALCK